MGEHARVAQEIGSTLEHVCVQSADFRGDAAEGGRYLN
jgi:hypothetical protein